MAVFFFGLYFSVYVQTYILAVYVLFLWLPCVPSLFRAPRARLKVGLPERTLTGAKVAVTVEVAAEGRRSQLDLSLAGWGLPLPLDISPEEGASVGTLAPGESRTVRLELTCGRRGVYTLPGWRLQSDFPFGLVNAYRVIREQAKLIVHPAFLPLRSLALPTGRRWQPGGVLTAASTGDSFEYAGNRSWREGDSLRDIDWRATARHYGAPDGGLVVREWREEYFLRVGVILDTHVPRAGSKAARNARLETLERAVSVCAALSDALAARDYLVDLFAAGPKLLHLTTGRGTAYKEQILDELALVGPTDDEPLSQIAPKLAEDLEKLTTVICLLLDWDAPRRAFVDELRAQGVGVRVALFTDDETVPRIDDPDLRVLTPAMVTAGNVAL